MKAITHKGTIKKVMVHQGAIVKAIAHKGTIKKATVQLRAIKEATVIRLQDSIMFKIAFPFCSFASVEKKYSQVEKEGLVIIYAAMEQ